MPRKAGPQAVKPDDPETWEPELPEDRKTDNYVNRSVSYRVLAWLGRVYQPRDRLVWRIYRLWPIIDRKLSDPSNPSNIGEYAEPLSVEDLLKQWGAGLYSVRMNDEGRPQGKQAICQCRIDLEKEQGEHPPVLDLKELVVSAPKNRSYVEGLIARGLLKRDGDNKVSPNSGGNDSAVVGQILQFARQSMAQHGSDPSAAAVNKTIEIMAGASDKAIAHVLKNAAGTGEGALVPIVVAMIQSQAQMQTTMLSLLVESKKAAPAAAGGLDGVTKLLIDLATTFGIKVPGTEKGGAMEAFVERIPEMLNGLANIAATYRGAADPLATLPTSGQTIDATATPTTTTGATRQPPQPGLPAAQLHQLAIKVMEKIGEEVSGYDYAHAIRINYNLATYFFISNMGQANLVNGLLQAEPRLTHMRAQVEQFVAEFIRYGVELQEQQQTDEGEGEKTNAETAAAVN